MTGGRSPLVIWHDIECGTYTADLPLWRRLARESTGPVLDIGAGTGRVALDLAGEGHEVVALDLEPALLAAMSERAAEAGLDVPIVIADAAGFDLGDQRFGLIIVPMQTVQLLAGAEPRAGLLTSARRHLRPGGLLAIALAEQVDAFDSDLPALPDPDRGEQDGWRYVSQPVAVRHAGSSMALERLRETVAPDGGRSTENDVIELAYVDAAGLASEGIRAGLRPEPVLQIPETDRHVGSEVVLLRA